MQIRHEAPSPDLSFTARAPLTLVLSDGVRRGIERWSLKGFAVDDGWAADVDGGTLQIPFQGVDIGFAVRFDYDEEGYASNASQPCQ